MSHWPIHSIHGGIHPPENKQQSTQCAIQAAPLPQHLTVPLLQHIGQTTEPCVSEGVYVYKGQLIAQASDGLSASVHAPSSGTVTRIALAPYPHASGQPFMAIEIATDGLDQWAEEPTRCDPASLSNVQLLQRIQQAGISGMGGAGFPTAAKLNNAQQTPINTLIINGTECEPYITADDLLMRERAQQVMLGIDVLVRLLQPKRVLIAIEDNKPEAIAAMRAQLDVRAYHVVSLPTLYPSGGERQLVQLLTGQEVPSGGLPSDLGILCQNVGTAAAVHDAVLWNRPLISRITTLTGAALSRPMNVECLIGTPVQDLLELAGVDKQQLSRVIMGGPMMGFSLTNWAAPIIKTSNCIIAGTARELPDPGPALACIRCGECERVCPSQLLPQQLLFFATGEDHTQLHAHNLFDCIECGACAYVCASKIPLVQYYRAAKADIRELAQKQAKSEQARLRFEARQERLRLEEERKAAERLARAERLAKVKAAQAKSAAQDSPASATGMDESALKQLKIAASMARVALKKAEKQLAQHDTEALHTQVAQLQRAATEAQQALAQAEQATLASAPAATPDAAVKTAKIQLAMQRAALKKAERADADDTELAKLRVAVQTAEQALAALEPSAGATTHTAPAATRVAAKPQLSTAEKQAKIQLAMQRAALKKAERANADDAELASLRDAVAAAQRALDQLEQPPSQGAD